MFYILVSVEVCRITDGGSANGKGKGLRRFYPAWISSCFIRVVTVNFSAAFEGSRFVCLCEEVLHTHLIPDTHSRSPSVFSKVFKGG